MENQSITKKCPSCQEKISLGVTKCPYCGKDFRNWFRQHPVLTIILVLFIIPTFLGGLFSNSDKSKKSESKTNRTTIEQKVEKEEISKEEQQRTLNNLSKTFCENRQGEYSYGVFFCNGCVNLSDMLNNSDKIYNAKLPASSENCQKIAEKCLAKWNEEQCQSIANKKVWLGMSGLQLYLSWGIPSDQNNTVGSWGYHSQWVYGSNQYVYLEGKTRDDAIVTSWQD